MISTERDANPGRKQLPGLVPANAAGFSPPEGCLPGFTLVELLVIIALLALWMTLLMPAFAGNPNHATSIRCLNNQRQLAAAWKMYAADNSEKLIGNYSLSEMDIEIQDQTYRNWVHNALSWATYASNTNSALLKVGKFAAYLGNDVRIYKCPCDNYLSAAQISLGWAARVRSISMNAYFGPYNSTWASDRNSFFSGYRQFLKLSSVPRPADLFVFADEHPDSINDGYLLNDANPATFARWGDLPASYHQGGAGFSFSDGHAEIHMWKSSATKLPVRTNTFALVPFTAANAGTLDRDWMTAHASIPF